ncbi:hypothetical protein L5515_003574 [Caenorhabditis briggsae]|uniref:Uncharacterized protein n=1 Tax=Caenorhabditis briggsae TaxID=6238 RepID=A0AAE9EI81_CAEBR|nr:hypothetical protein L5515_003574 [Caenorhabditis briggsae]
MRPQEETDTEAGTKEKENRKKAGFELAAEPTEVIIFFPTIYYMFGIAVIVTVLSIILWICTAAIWSFFVWATLATLSIGLIIFLQHHQFCNPLVLLGILINLLIKQKLTFQIAFCIYTLVMIIKLAAIIADKREEVKKKYPGYSQKQYDGTLSTS